MEGKKGGKAGREGTLRCGVISGSVEESFRARCGNGRVGAGTACTCGEGALCRACNFHRGGGCGLKKKKEEKRTQGRGQARGAAQRRAVLT